MKKQNCFVLGSDEVNIVRVLNNVCHESIHDYNPSNLFARARLV